MESKLMLSIVVSFLLIIGSCNSSNKPNNTKGNVNEILSEDNKINNKNTKEETIKDTATYKEQFSEHFDYLPLQEIYENWVQLTELEGETVIYKPCEAQNPSIWINYFPDDGGTPIIYLGFGQDSEQFDILNVEKKEEDLLIKCTNDIAIIYRSDSINKKIAYWTIPNYFNNTAFVAQDFEGDYKKIEENCDYMY